MQAHIVKTLAFGTGDGEWQEFKYGTCQVLGILLFRHILQRNNSLF